MQSKRNITTKPLVDAEAECHQSAPLLPRIARLLQANPRTRRQIRAPLPPPARFMID